MGYKVHSVNGQMGEVVIQGGGSAAWDDITDKPDEFPPGMHVHAAADVSSGTLALARIPTGTSASTVSLGNHTHAGLTADAAAGTASIRTLGSGAVQAAAGDHTHTAAAVGAAAATHTHAAADLASGVLAIARIPTGATSTTVSLGNHTHTGLLNGTASAVADATDETDVVAQLNALLAVLRTRGVIST